MGYKEKLEEAKGLYESANYDQKNILEIIFPELRESEDERIKREIVAYINELADLKNEKIPTKWLAWLEKQGEQKETLCDKCRKEQPSHSCQDITALGRCAVEHEQKSADKIEPKFKVGNWYQCTKDFFGKGVTFDKNTAYFCAKDGCLQCEYGCHIAIVKDLYDNFKLWTIQDAKDGDVLYSLDSKQPFIFKHRKPNEQAEVYCGINIYGKFFVGNTKDCIITTSNYIPATKEQRDTLMKAMTDEGYTFDFEKKELKRVGEEVNGEDYGIDDLYRVQRIFQGLEKTPGKVDGYQSDDGILEHKSAITAIKKLYEQKPDWSKEDEKMVNDIIAAIDTLYYHGMVNWLKSLRNRVQPQLGWSEENEKMLNRLIGVLEGINKEDYHEGWEGIFLPWLKSLKEKERYTWKPSEEQIIALNNAVLLNEDHYNGAVLSTLLEQLKKL